MKKAEIKELSALISLLDEPNEENFGSIRQKIQSHGLNAIPMLEDAWLQAEEELNARRIEELIDEIRFNELYFELENWAKSNSEDMIPAFILLTKFRYPDFEESKYLEKIEKLKQDVWLEMNENLTALEKVKVINHIIYDIYKFKGQLPNQTTINSFYLNETLDSGKGSAVALGILYASVAQKIGVPVFGVDLHLHFILAYMEDNQLFKNPAEYSDDEILFYIAVVNKGSVFTKNEIKRYLEQLKLKAKPSYFSPCDNISVIKRLMTDTISAYRKEKMDDKAELLTRLMVALG